MLPEFQLPPMHVHSGGWLPETNPQITRYVGFFSATNLEMRDVWYGEFAQRATVDYECLGYIIDWLRSVAMRAETNFVVFEEEDQQIRDMRREIILSEARQPRKIVSNFSNF